MHVLVCICSNVRQFHLHKGGGVHCFDLLHCSANQISAECCLEFAVHYGYRIGMPRVGMRVVVWGGSAFLWVGMECLSYCSQLQHSAVVAPHIPDPHVAFLHHRKLGCCCRKRCVRSRS